MLGKTYLNLGGEKSYNHKKFGASFGVAGFIFRFFVCFVVCGMGLGVVCWLGLLSPRYKNTHMYIDSLNENAR